MAYSTSLMSFLKKKSTDTSNLSKKSSVLSLRHHKMNVKRHYDATMQQTEAPILKIGHFVLLKTLGTGAFSKVKIGVHEKTEHIVAVKIIDRSSMRRQRLSHKIEREIINQTKIDHPHIIQMLQVIGTQSHIFMIMEYADGGDLLSYMLKHRKMGNDEARRIFQQIISAVDYCHRMDIVHRDLKPENILLTCENNVKVADFGLSHSLIDGKLLKTSCGTVNYAAPELLWGKHYVGPEVDIWSCGVICYSMLCGHLPFNDTHIPTLYRKIKTGNFQIHVYLGADVVYLLKRMINIDPIKRATIDEIKENHWFVKSLPAHLFTHNPENVDIDEIYARKFQQTASIGNSCLPTLPEHKRLTPIKDASDENSHISFEIDNRSAWDKDHLLHVKERLLLETPINGLHKLRIEQLESASSSPRSSGASTPFRHPERIDPNMHISSTLDFIEENSTLEEKNTHILWHLGIRSHSRSADIMLKAYQSLKSANYEWQKLSAYHLIARKIGADLTLPKISIRLYQINHTSYLIDFMSISDHDDPFFRARQSVSAAKHRLHSSDNSAQCIHTDQMANFVIGCDEVKQDPYQQLHPVKPHAIYFFDQCCEIIRALSK